MFNHSHKPEDELQYIKVCSIKDIQSGERLFFTVGEESLVLLNIDNKFFALADKCSHDDGPLGDGQVDNCEIICPRHGAKFQLSTGKATKMPAIIDIPAFPVKIVNDQILVGFPKEN